MDHNNSLRTYDQAFLFAMGETDRTSKSKKRALMFADFYDVVPVAVTDEDGNEVDVILSPSHVEKFQTMLAKPTPLTVSRPVQEASPQAMFPTRDTVNSIGEFGAYSGYLTKRHYTELSKEMIEILNQDWEIKPSQRFIVARALIGSVIIDSENNRGLLILALEVYGRDPDIDSHAEQRSSTGSTRQSTSVPSVGHNDFEIITMRQTEGNNISIKLILGTHSFNALVTASTRIDNLVDQPECGPNTVNFGVPPNSHTKYKLHVDSESWSDSVALEKKTNLQSIYTHSRLMQLRQLRTRFDKLDTYSASRSALFHGYLQQPMTVFTYGKNTTSINSGTLSSRFLAMLATSVMRDGQNAYLGKTNVENLITEFNKETKAKRVIQQVLQLFGDNDTIPIIGNTDLNYIAEELANLLASYLSNTNKKSVIPSLSDHLKSY
ncbi:uncharacterized protein EV154DRAFT_548888 [Mucor mucedo]|uniref:uncharacterized protein n=1 Tax=Mucor mucedo TaxID=29922 RepID=UPI00221FD3E4|nr:uncharacterized protein EV154DRAFT_548888 [Mucor mucedo]KAI7894743.1 hypothetical protein EV154DRAFT_548888 [Mucor mucedo]